MPPKEFERFDLGELENYCKLLDENIPLMFLNSAQKSTMIEPRSVQKANSYQ